jgi:hypothetical protein
MSQGQRLAVSYAAIIASGIATMASGVDHPGLIIGVAFVVMVWVHILGSR